MPKGATATKRAVKPSPKTVAKAPPKTPANDGAMESISRVLNGCRAQIDEMLVQLDLGKLDIREGFNDQKDTAENAFLAARSAMSHAGHDAGETLKALRQGLDRVVHDLGRAVADVDAAVKRGA